MTSETSQYNKAHTSNKEGIFFPPGNKLEFMTNTFTIHRDRMWSSHGSRTVSDENGNLNFGSILRVIITHNILLRLPNI